MIHIAWFGRHESMNSVGCKMGKVRQKLNILQNQWIVWTDTDALVFTPWLQHEACSFSLFSALTVTIKDTQQVPFIRWLCWSHMWNTVYSVVAVMTPAHVEEGRSLWNRECPVCPLHIDDLLNSLTAVGRSDFLICQLKTFCCPTTKVWGLLSSSMCPYLVDGSHISTTMCPDDTLLY